jgi:hypothetical protein
METISMSETKLSTAPLAAGRARDSFDGFTFKSPTRTPNSQKTQANRASRHVFISRLEIGFEDRNGRRSDRARWYVEPVFESDSSPLFFAIDGELSRGAQS